MEGFLSQDSNLVLLLSYLDARSLAQTAQVSKRFRKLVNDDSLWQRLAKRMGFEECKFHDQSWKECIQDLYCPVELDSVNSSRPYSLLKLECIACWRHLSSLKQKQLAKARKDADEDDDDLMLSSEIPIEDYVDPSPHIQTSSPIGIPTPSASFNSNISSQTVSSLESRNHLSTSGGVGSSLSAAATSPHNSSNSIINNNNSTPTNTARSGLASSQGISLNTSSASAIAANSSSPASNNHSIMNHMNNHASSTTNNNHTAADSHHGSTSSSADDSGGLHGKVICRLHKVKQNDRKLCVVCRHLAVEHCTHLQYREAQLSRYLAAYDRKDFPEMVRRISAIVRISGGALRPQEKNLLSAAYNIHVNSLKSEWKIAKQKGKQEIDRKNTLANQIITISDRLLRLLDDKIFPYVGLDSIIRWMKLKIKFLEVILEVGTPEALSVTTSSSNNHVMINNNTYHQDILMTSSHPNQSSSALLSLEKRDEISIQIRHLKNVLDQVNTHQETLDLPANDPIMLQLALSYCEYCDVVVQNRMRAYRLAKTSLLEATRLEQEKGRSDNKLVALLEAFVVNIEESKVLHKQKCQKVIKQGYLRRKDSTEEELTLPCWLVFGYWDFYTCLFLYDKIESEEANEVILITPDLNVEVNGDNDKSFRIEPLPVWWYASTTKERDEWCFILESAKKTR